ncbi:MAG TPA: 3-deoxy-manno-octulosonate cytidylyltransferase [bacterium]|nr:3-deoxy-manno-octulosonate cytidylyltransferase [bacterium]
MERIVCVIPARYGSERLPGKVLYEIKGKTVLQHVYERAKKIKYFSKIIIATDDERVKSAAEKFGAEAVITPKFCRTGSDRVAEVVKDMDVEIAVNIQADEPFLPKEAVEKPLLLLLKDKSLNVATSAVKIRKKEELYDPNIVKVVLDKDNFALYFSRSLIPFPRIYFSDDKLPYLKNVVFYKHIGVYIFRKDFLMEFSKMETSFLEKIEKLEQLRIMENGYKIKVVVIKKDSPSVDTIQDIKRLRNE